MANLDSNNVGRKTEAKVADYIQEKLGIKLTDYANKIKDSTGEVIGEIDCATESVIIEVKTSIASVRPKQFFKLTDIYNKNYINITNKKVILYIDDKIDNLNQSKLNEIRELGIKVVNDLEELKGVLE